jgi:hypothetical protein
MLISACEQTPTGAGAWMPPSLVIGRQASDAAIIIAAETPGSAGGAAQSGTMNGAGPDAAPTAPVGAGAAQAATFSLEVRDEGELPIAGATVLLSDGRRAETGADGRFTMAGPFKAGAVVVSKPGYATSVVAGLEAPTPLHLQRADGRGELFVQRTRTFRGTAIASEGQLRGGAVHFLDSQGSAAAPSALDAATGAFDVQVTATRPGEATGVLLIVATDQNGRTLIGASRPFNSFTGEPGAVRLYPATREIRYDVGGKPASLSRVQARLELHQAGAPTVVLHDLKAATSGRFMAPADGLLPGTLRVTVEARDHDRTANSLVSRPPVDGRMEGTFLAPPDVSFHSPSGRLTWNRMDGISGYRAEVRQPHNLIAPAWEAWLGQDTEVVVPQELRQAASSGEVVVEAVEADNLTSRSVAMAGPRALRVLPWRDAISLRTAWRRLAPRS